MHVIIGGCGRVGSQLAEHLAEAGHDVVAVDRDERNFDALGDAFNGETVVGDITDSSALEKADIARADAFAAVTSFDNANLMAVEIARTIYGVERTVARLFHPERESSYRKMGVHYVSGTQLVAKAILNEIETEAFPRHVSLPESDVELVEMRVLPDGHGVTVAEFERCGAARIAVLRRGDRARVPKPDDRLREEDLLVASLRRGGEAEVRRWVCNPYAEVAAG